MLKLAQREPQAIYLIKSVRIPIDCIKGIRKTKSGFGCIVETERGITTVEDQYEDVFLHVYGRLADDDAR